MSTTDENVARTMRVAPEVDRRLRLLSKILKRPISKLMAEALDRYLATALAEVEREAEGLADLARAARDDDPEGTKAIATFIANEQAIETDPADGRMLHSSTARPAKPPRITADDLFVGG